MTRFSERVRTVYFIRPIGMQGPVKIGCSFSPNKRRAALETWCPFPLEIIAEISGSMDIERRFHSMFRDQHKGREWFDWSPELQRVIDKVAGGSFDLDSLPSAYSLPCKTPRIGNGWSDRSRRVHSYAMRIRHIEKKLKFFLPHSLTGWRSFIDDPRRIAPLEAFIDDPCSHGLTDHQHRLETIERLKRVNSDWARNRVTELSGASRVGSTDRLQMVRIGHNSHDNGGI